MFSALLLLSAVVVHTNGCTMIAVGKNATVDGSTLIAHTDDAGGGAADIRLVRVPAQQYPAGSQRPVYDFNGGYPRLVSMERGPHYKPVDGQQVMKPLGFIPQVNYTYAYFDQDYGMMNEVQLAIGESTCAAKTVGWPSDKPYGYNMFGIAELSKVALERCDSAQCAVQTMGDLAVKYGFYSEDSGSPLAPGYVNAAETVGIADKYGETWVFHVMTGENNASAIWAAKRVPDDHVAVVANGFVIRHLNLSDNANYLASPNIASLAREMGWWNPETDGEFDFTAAYGMTPPGPLFPLYTGRRIWRVFDLIAPSLHLDSTLGSHPAIPTYPFSVRPDLKINARQVMNILMDHYEGTEYDMTQGIAAGPFGVPVRYDGPSKNVTGGWERAISMFRTMFSFVLQSRGDLNDAVGGIAWYAHASPHGSVYVPFSCAQDIVPESYLKGKESEFSTDSAWWAFSFVNNWSYLRYNIISKDIKTEQQRLQDLTFEHVEMIRAQATTLNISGIQDRSNAMASQIVKDWWALAWKLVSKFTDGYILTGEAPDEMIAPGYPKPWLEATSFSKWPGQSYHPPDHQHENVVHGPSFLYGVLMTLVVLTLVILLAGLYGKYKKRSIYHKLSDV